MWNCIGIDRNKRQLNPTWGVDRRHPSHMNVYQSIKGAVVYIHTANLTWNTSLPPLPAASRCCRARWIAYTYYVRRRT